MALQSTTAEQSFFFRWLKLAFAVCLIIVAWSVVLPQIQRWNIVRQRIERHERLQIEPAATFYSDQPAVESAVIHIDSARRQHPHAWWQFGN